ncbi:hypothetical protein [Vibrio alfacsensis]|uniref:hypothetical protein n=1 Tax=Vibrio alfacsensis TaxID=1074311 RepID=UPI004068A9ED
MLAINDLIKKRALKLMREMNYQKQEATSLAAMTYGEESSYEIYSQENVDDLSKESIQSNLKQLTKVGVEFSIFEPTITGLKKSILDATQTIRTHFELEGFHFYGEQSQGLDNKVMKDSYFLTDDKCSGLMIPDTKLGGKVSTINEVLNDKTTTTYIFC